jgi:uncharacterized protein YdbL (DUF1318 family)
MASPARERRNLRAAALAVAAALALLIAPAAHADSLDDAKAAGYVGERTDGMLGLVKNDAPADVKALIASVNAKRRESYASIAKKNGTTLEAVASLAGKKAIARTKPGNFVQDASGNWVKK